MTDKRIENIHVHSEDQLITPEELKRDYPLTEAAVHTVMQGQQTIKNILNRKDPRLFVVVGPCSVHDVEAAREYAARLKTLARKVGESLFLVMRVYFEKPRTSTGWQGLINDPHLDNSYRLDEGLHLARRLLLDLASMGLPAAGEALDLVSPQYIQDLFSWTAIGARTTESQSHRKMASGLSSAVGFKNGTDGNIEIAVNAIRSAAGGHHFLSIDPAGKVAVIRTQGNPDTHVVLRGGTHRPNYDAESIKATETQLLRASLKPNIMVDCSHANSLKDPARQLLVLEEVTRQIAAGNRSIIAVMLESNLKRGKQSVPADKSQLRYGVSITDACLDWEATKAALLKMHEELREVLPRRLERALQATTS